MQPRSRQADPDAMLVKAMRDLERAVQQLRSSQEAFSAMPGDATKIELYAAMADEADSLAKVEILKRHDLHVPRRP